MSVTTIGANTTNTFPNALTAPGGANTKSAWTEISSSTPATANAIIMTALNGAADTDCLVDIGTGASSSEVVLVGDIHLRTLNTSFNKSSYFYIPVPIASGTRVAMRYQSTATTANTVRPMIHLLNETQGVPLTGCAATTYGAVTADSGAIAVDPGGSINTKGAYSEIVASTSADIDWLTVVIGNRNNTAVATGYWLLDIATGASSSEVVVIPNIFLDAHAAADSFLTHAIGPFPVVIPSGTRLAARAQSTIADGTDRQFDVAIIGYNGTPAGGSGGGSHFSVAMMG